MKTEELRRLKWKLRAYDEVLDPIWEGLKTLKGSSPYKEALAAIVRCLENQRVMIEMAIKTREKET